jgi:hypothetical protein
MNSQNQLPLLLHEQSLARLYYSAPLASSVAMLLESVCQIGRSPGPAG